LSLKKRKTGLRLVSLLARQNLYLKNKRMKNQAKRPIQDSGSMHPLATISTWVLRRFYAPKIETAMVLICKIASLKQSRPNNYGISYVNAGSEI
jgi:hypothetical protein